MTQGQTRHRYLGDRIMMLLLYRAASAEEGLERLEDGSVLLRMGPFSRSVRLNSSKAYDMLLFLQSLGYILSVDTAYQYNRVRCILATPLAKSTPT